MTDDPRTSEKVKRIEDALEDADFTVLGVDDIRHTRGCREFTIDLDLFDQGGSDEQ